MNKKNEFYQDALSPDEEKEVQELRRKDSRKIDVFFGNSLEGWTLIREDLPFIDFPSFIEDYLGFTPIYNYSEYAEGGIIYNYGSHKDFFKLLPKPQPLISL